MHETTAAPASAATVASPGRLARWKVVLLQLVFAYLLLVRLAYDVAAMPMGDEAYYWMWGQHLSWSYFDHPPLDGWLQGLVAALFGWSNFSVRLLTWLSLGGTLWVLWLWSARLAPHDRSGWFWATAVIFLSMPVIYLMTTGALHDHLLIALSLASIYVFDGFASTAEDGTYRWRDLYIAAIFLGLAVLTKYNGVFVGIGFAVWILVRPKLWPLLARWQLWLAGLVAVAMQAPVFYWNLTEGLASFRFHLDSRGMDWADPEPERVLYYLGAIVLVISPVLFAMLFRIPFLRSAGREADRALGLSTTIFVVSTLAWAVIALFLTVYFHWNIVAYLGLAPIAYRLLGNRIRLLLHVAWGLFLITPAMLSYFVTPLSLFGQTDPAAPEIYGWPELKAEVQKQHDVHPDAFLAGTRYTFASQLGFMLHDPDIAAFNPVPSQIDYWWDAGAHVGQPALIVADTAFGIDNAKASFASLQKLEDVPVTRFGQTIWTFQIWLGTGFNGRLR